MSLRTEVEQILHEKRLLKLVSALGKTFVGGSYYYDLMCWRDLDIYVLAPEVSISEFFQLGGEISEAFSSSKSFYTNNRGKNPDGLYWGIRVGDPKAGGWKFDIWALRELDFERHRDYAVTLAQRLTPETRTAILDIKTLYWNKPEYRDQVTSDLIYRAVLDGGCRNIEDFESYRKAANRLD